MKTLLLRHFLAFAVAATAAIPFSSISRAVAISGQGYFEEYLSTNCLNSVVCNVTFSAVPTGKTFVVSNVSCIYTAGVTAVPQIATLTKAGGGGAITFLTPTLLLTTSGFRRYVTNEAVTKIYLPGHAPQANITFSALQNSITIACSITGKRLP